jgi:3-oxoacyl-[acyl-carrier protein] reductase
MNSHERNQVALVVGATGGIGSQIAHQLHAQGWNLALGYRSQPVAAETLAATLRASSPTSPAVVAVQLDVTDEVTISSSLQTIHSELGLLSTLIIASGPYIDMIHTSQVQPRRLASQLATDVVGPLAVINAALPDLRSTQGSITVLTTAATARTARKDVLSSVPKAALEMLIRQLAAEEGRFGVRANGVGVGPIIDGMYEKLVADGYFTEEWLTAATRNIPLGRLGTAMDIAQAVCFFASHEASWITGQTLMVDGGYSA